MRTKPVTGSGSLHVGTNIIFGIANATNKVTMMSPYLRCDSPLLCTIRLCYIDLHRKFKDEREAKQKAERQKYVPQPLRNE